MKPVIIIAIAFVFLFVPITTFSETESFTVAARNYYDFQIFMNSGDEISFAMGVSGGSNDDIILTLYSPTNSKLIDGVVYDQFSDNFSAVNSGTYTFRFDNTGWVISNKVVSFSYEVKINTYYVYVDT
ncbi:MAG: emp24/gp25L/p24 family protein, partial [Nitrosopumilus sp.]